MNPWLLLSVAIAAEVTATLALRWSNGLTRPIPTIVVVVGYGVAFWLLSRIVQQLPPSVTYAVWAGAGVALVAVAGVVLFGEAMSLAKVVSLALIVAGVVGLNVYGGAHDEVATPSRPGSTATSDGGLR